MMTGPKMALVLQEQTDPDDSPFRGSSPPWLHCTSSWVAEVPLGLPLWISEHWAHVRQPEPSRSCSWPSPSRAPSCPLSSGRKPGCYSSGGSQACACHIL